MEDDSEIIYAGPFDIHLLFFQVHEQLWKGQNYCTLFFSKNHLNKVQNLQLVAVTFIEDVAT